MNKENKRIMFTVLLLAVFLGLILLLFNVVSEESYDWEDDGIILMQNSETGEFACFGCNNVLCVDPAPVMQPVDGTRNRYCDDDFEVVGG